MDHTSSQGRQKSSLLRWWRCYQWQGHWTRTHSLWDNIITATYCSWELQRSTLDPPTKNGRGHGWTYHKQEGHFPSNALENHNPNQGFTTIAFLCKKLLWCPSLTPTRQEFCSITSTLFTLYKIEAVIQCFQWVMVWPYRTTRWTPYVCGKLTCSYPHAHVQYRLGRGPSQ